MDCATSLELLTSSRLSRAGGYQASCISAILWQCHPQTFTTHFWFIGFLFCFFLHAGEGLTYRIYQELRGTWRCFVKLKKLYSRFRKHIQINTCIQVEEFFLTSLDFFYFIRTIACQRLWYTLTLLLILSCSAD